MLKLSAGHSRCPHTGRKEARRLPTLQQDTPPGGWTDGCVVSCSYMQLKLNQVLPAGEPAIFPFFAGRRTDVIVISRFIGISVFETPQE